MQTRSIRILFGLLTLAAALSAGCQAPQQYFESLKGNGFTGWSSEVGEGVRSADPNAKPSGFFTDRRSEQIEQSLGGGF